MVKTVFKHKFIKKNKRATVADITGQMAVMAVGSTADHMAEEAQEAEEHQVKKPYYTWKYSEQDEVWYYYEWYNGYWWRRNLSWTRMTEYF